MSRWFLSPWPSEGASCPTMETRPSTLIIFWSLPVLGSFCTQHLLKFVFILCQNEWKDLEHPEALNRSECAFGTFLSQCWCRTQHSPESWSVYLITAKKVTLPKVHQKKHTTEIINLLTFSAFPDPMWQQRSRTENLFHFPSSFAISMFLFSSLLCEHEVLCWLSPTSTHGKNTLELGAGTWAGEEKAGLQAGMAPLCRMMGTRS